MATPLTLEQARLQLKLETNEEDQLVVGLLAAATRAVEIHTGRTFAAGVQAFEPADADVAAQAALMLVTAWYDNREGYSINAASAELPLAVTWLLWPLKRLTI